MINKRCEQGNVEPPWGIEPQTYALRELPSPHTRCAPRTSLHVKPFTVLSEDAGSTPFRCTNGSTFDLAGASPGPPDAGGFLGRRAQAEHQHDALLVLPKRARARRCAGRGSLRSRSFGALRDVGWLARYPGPVSAERDELKRLVQQLPAARGMAVRAEARRQTRPHPAAEWPPAWFGSFESGRPDLGRNHDDLLAEGFGR